MRILALLLLSASALAAQVTVNVNLTGAQEVPANGSTASGTATLTLNGNLLSFTVNYSGFTFNAGQTNNGGGTVAHIHGDPVAGPSIVGRNAGVVLDIEPFHVGLYDGAFAGQFTVTDLDISGAGFTNLRNSLALGRAYFNLHTGQFPGGEIRGDITTPVPEPATWAALIGALALGVALLRRRR